MSKPFASQADLAEKKISFERLSDNAYAYVADGDPNSGVIIGDDSVMVVDATATPAMAQALIQAIRGVTDKPIRHVALTHYHAVRVLGASAFVAEGAANVYASRGTHESSSNAARPTWTRRSAASRGCSSPPRPSPG